MAQAVKAVKANDLLPLLLSNWGTPFIFLLLGLYFILSHSRCEFAVVVCVRDAKSEYCELLLLKNALTLAIPHSPVAVGGGGGAIVGAVLS